MKISWKTNSLCRQCARTVAPATLLVALTVSAHAQFLGPASSLATSPATSPAASPAAASDVAAAMVTTATLHGEQNSVLIPGDLIEVQVYGVPQYDFKGRIDNDGTASLPLIGAIQLGDQPVAAAEKMIESKLVETHNMLEPHVFLHVTESPNHFATVSGEVKTPGPVQLYGDRRLLDVLSAAGGLTQLASSSLTIIRRGVSQPIVVLLPADAATAAANNIPVYPGDNIIVSKLGVVYVLGAFHQQGALPLRNNAPVTLVEAMSLAGGVNYEAAIKKAFILRMTPGGQVEIPFNVTDVERHRVPDTILQNEDIILIPTSNMKAALKGGAAAVAATLVAGIGYMTVR